MKKPRFFLTNFMSKELSWCFYQTRYTLFVSKCVYDDEMKFNFLPTCYFVLSGSPKLVCSPDKHIRNAWNVPVTCEGWRIDGQTSWQRRKHINKRPQCNSTDHKITPAMQGQRRFVSNRLEAFWVFIGWWSPCGWSKRLVISGAVMCCFYWQERSAGTRIYSSWLK
jgi:hypothetical protein